MKYINEKSLNKIMATVLILAISLGFPYYNWGNTLKVYRGHADIFVDAVFLAILILPVSVTAIFVNWLSEKNNRKYYLTLLIGVVVLSFIIIYLISIFLVDWLSQYFLVNYLGFFLIIVALIWFFVWIKHAALIIGAAIISLFIHNWIFNLYIAENENFISSASHSIAASFFYLIMSIMAFISAAATETIFLHFRNKAGKLDRGINLRTIIVSIIIGLLNGLGWAIPLFMMI